MFQQLKNQEEIFYHNQQLKPFGEIIPAFSKEQLEEVKQRWERFRPLLALLFPEVKDGIIDSSLDELNQIQEVFHIEGKVLLKRDDSLPIAGSVKARGGIYEVLCHTEKLALENHIIDSIDDDYTKIANHKDFFSRYKIQVGSTGNLGMSIGIMSAKLGYQAIIHMSNDAVEWKKEKLRKAGAIVKEYEGNYEEAVKQGRKESNADPYSYFVDDENSQLLFLGYTSAAYSIQRQLNEKGIIIDQNNPLYAYLPCGVGGAPGGIAYGLKQLYQDNVYCYFIEPTNACCMTLGLMSHKYHEISIEDIGLDGKTYADGLAVGRCSALVAKIIEPYLAGCMTIKDGRLFDYLRLLDKYEGIFIEPSSCASLQGLAMNKVKGVHICYATGGSFVPEPIRKAYLDKYID